MCRGCVSMTMDGLLRSKLVKYRHAELCRQDCAQAIHRYNSLIPDVQKFVHSDGREAELLALDGTLPVKIRGKMYNIPVCVWLQENHPYVPPLVYVKPTSSMAIKPSRHVDTNGRVHLPFLHDWSYPKSDLAALLQILCCIFAEHPPVYAKPAQPQPAVKTQPAASCSIKSPQQRPYPLQSGLTSQLANMDGHLRRQLAKYKHAELCQQDCARAIHRCNGLMPNLQKFIHNDGREAELLALDGTLPVTIRGVAYNIPVCVWLQENHPHVPPLVYVKPTSSMALKPSQHVDTSGRVHLPFLHDWSYPKSDLTALLQVLCCVFMEHPPVYTKIAQPPPANNNRSPYPV